MTKQGGILMLAYHAKVLAAVMDGMMDKLEINAEGSKVTLVKNGHDIESKSLSDLIHDTHQLAVKMMEKP